MPHLLVTPSNRSLRHEEPVPEFAKESGRAAREAVCRELPKACRRNLCQSAMVVRKLELPHGIEPREAAEECSPRRKPWVEYGLRGKPQRGERDATTQVPERRVLCDATIARLACFHLGLATTECPFREDKTSKKLVH